MAGDGVHVQPHPGREPQRLRGEVQALLPRAGEVLPGKRAWHRASERAVHRYAFQRGVAGAVPSSTAHAIAGNVFTGTGRVKSAITSITSSIWARTSRSMAADHHRSNQSEANHSPPARAGTHHGRQPPNIEVEIEPS